MAEKGILKAAATKDYFEASGSSYESPRTLPIRPVSGRRSLVFAVLLAACVGTGMLLSLSFYHETKLTQRSVEVGMIITCYSEASQTLTWDGILLGKNATQTFTTTLIVLGNDGQIVDFAVVFGKMTIEEISDQQNEQNFEAGYVDLVPIAMVQVNSTSGEIVGIEVSQKVEPHELEDGLRLVRQVAFKPEDYSRLYSQESNAECRHPAVFNKQKYCPAVSHLSTDLRNIYRSHYSDESSPEGKLTDESTRFNITEEVVINNKTELIETSIVTVFISRQYHWNASSSFMRESTRTITTEFVQEYLDRSILNELQVLFFSGNYSTVSISASEFASKKKRELFNSSKRVKIFEVFGQLVYIISNLQVADQARTSKSLEFAGKNVFISNQVFGGEGQISIGKLAALKRAVNASSTDMIQSITHFKDYLNAELPTRINAKVDDIKKIERELNKNSQPCDSLVLQSINNLAEKLQKIKDDFLDDLGKKATNLQLEIDSLQLQGLSTEAKKNELQTIKDQIKSVNDGTYSFNGLYQGNIDSVLDDLKKQIAEIKLSFSGIASIATSLANGISQDFATFSNSYKTYATTMKSNFLSISNFQPLPFGEISTNVFSYAFFDKQAKSIIADLNTFSESVPAFSIVSATVAQLNTDIKSDIQETVWTSAFNNIKLKLQGVLDTYRITSSTPSNIDNMKSDFVASLGQPMDPLVRCIASECAQAVSSTSLSSAHSDLQDSLDMKTTKVNDFLKQYMKKTGPTNLSQKTEIFTISDINSPLLHPSSISITGNFDISQSTEVTFVTDKSFTDTLKTIVNFRLDGSYEEQIDGSVYVKFFTGIDCQLELSSTLEYFSIISKITGKEIASMSYSGKYDGKVLNWVIIGQVKECKRVKSGKRWKTICANVDVYGWSEPVRFVGGPIVGKENLQLEGFTP